MPDLPQHRRPGCNPSLERSQAGHPPGRESSYDGLLRVAGSRFDSSRCQPPNAERLSSRELLDDLDVYTQIGEDGFARLVRAFYAQVPADDVLGPMYPADDLPGAEARLRDFLVGRFGGPQRYIESRGHPRLRARHAPFVIDRRARDRWVALMTRALDEARLPKESDDVLRRFFHDTATFMMNRG